jgi:hypothetical protein
MMEFWLSSFVDIVFFGLLIFLNYVVWINRNIYYKYINYYLEKSEASEMVKPGAWKGLISSPNFIWFPRIVFLIALCLHGYSLFTYFV